MRFGRGRQEEEHVFQVELGSVPCVIEEEEVSFGVCGPGTERERCWQF